MESFTSLVEERFMNQEAYKQYNQNLPERIKKWLNARGINDEIINRSFIGWDKDKITIPIFDKNGEWLFFKYRKDPEDTNEDKPKYWHSLKGMIVLYGIENLNKNLSQIIICEGELDRLLLESKGFPAVTSIGGAGTFRKEWADEIKKISKIYICFDNDEAGMKGAERIAKLIPHARVITLPEMEEKRKDITDYFTLGNTVKDFRELMKKAKTSRKYIEDRERAEIEKEIEKGILGKISSFPIELIPAQDFQNGTAYVTTVIPIEIEEKVKEVPLLITSNREYFVLNEKTLFELGFRISRNPQPETRWSAQSIKEFLKGDISVEIKEIFEKIKEQFKFYIDFGEEDWYDFMSCWVIGTYFYRMFLSYPYILLLGDIESGKTKTQTLVALLSFNAELTFNSTPPYIIFAIHHNCATCCVDEAERLANEKSENAQVVISMYNEGYKKGVSHGKMEAKGQQWVPKKFDGYSPKIFASTKGLTPTLISRSIKIIMTRTPNKEIENREVGINNPIFQELRDKLYLVFMKYAQEIVVMYNNLTDEEILGREWELSKPILTIAKVIDEKLYQNLRSFLLKVQKEKREEILEEMTTPKLLESILRMIEANEKEEEVQEIKAGELFELEKAKEKEKIRLKFYSNKEIIDWLVQDDPENFSWLKDIKIKYPARWLGKELKKAKVVKGQAKIKKIGGESVRGHYLDKSLIQKRLEEYAL